MEISGNLALDEWNVRLESRSKGRMIETIRAEDWKKSIIGKIDRSKWKFNGRLERTRETRP